MQYETIKRACVAGEQKATRSFGRLMTLSILAGAFIALGSLLSVIIGYGFPALSSCNPALQRLLSASVFPIGLFLIVIFGADLFTGNNALLIPAMNERKIGFTAVLRNWVLVWIGNFAGVLLFMYLLAVGAGLFNNDLYRNAIISIAEIKTSLPWWQIILRGVGANWCVCLAVWLALGADGLINKALACWIPVAAFVALGYEHCIANMFFIPCGMAVGANVSVGALGLNLLFSTIGNIIGGAIFVGNLFHRLYHRIK